MLDGAGLAVALLAPAFPAQRRIVVDGQVRVDGRPPTRRRSRAIPTFPPTGSSVLGLLAAGGVRPMTAVPLATVRRGRDAMRGPAHALQRDRWPRRSSRTRRPTRISRSWRKRPTIAWRSWPAPPGSPPRSPVSRPPERASSAMACPRRPLVVVAGSAHPATRAQLSRLGPPRGPRRPGSARRRGRHDPARRRETVTRPRGRRARADRARAAGGAPPDRAARRRSRCCGPSAPAGSA